MSLKQTLEIQDLQKRLAIAEGLLGKLCDMAGLTEPDPGRYTLLDKKRGWYAVLRDGKECPEYPSMRYEQALEIVNELNRPVAA